MQDQGSTSSPSQQVKREDLSVLSSQFFRDYKLRGDDLKKLQVYTAGLVLLWRQLTDQRQARVQSGRLVSQNGKHYEVFVIAGLTPGVVESTSGLTGVSGKRGLPGLGKISVSFEPNCRMEFRAVADPDAFTPFDSFSRKISYCGHQYFGPYLADGDAKQVIDSVTRDLKVDATFTPPRPVLLVDLEAAKQLGGSGRVVRGRTLGK